MSSVRSETPDGSIPDEPTSPLRPIIHEMIRTQICRPDPKYLVDKISVQTQARDGEQRETFRLWTSDGEHAIQAILKRHAHPFVISGDICAGSYVRLLDYELAKFPKANGEGRVWVLVVADLCAIGHDGRERSDYGVEDVLVEEKMSEHEQEIAPTSPPGPQIEDDQNPSFEEELLALLNSPSARHVALSRRDESRYLQRPPSEPVHRPPSLLSTPRKRKALDDPTALSSMDPNVPGSRHREKRRMGWFGKAVTPPKKTLEEQTNELRARLMALDSTPSRQRTRAATETPSPSPLRQVRTLHPSARKVQTMPAPKPPSPSPKPITRPLKITPLADITGVKATRNTIHDFLAMIVHVNPRILSRKGFPDSREMLIMDRSTLKQVHVTVFVDAADFLPEPGTVALFRNLTTHEHNGGSLKAYVQRCAGKKWFIEESAGWQWEEEAEEIRRWFEINPRAWTLPDRIWWTERGLQKRSQNV